jgi:hypothetical protein
MAREMTPLQTIERELAGIASRRAADRPATLDGEREPRLRAQHRVRSASIELHGLGQIPEHRIKDSERRRKAELLAVVNAPRETIEAEISAEQEAADAEAEAERKANLINEDLLEWAKAFRRRENFAWSRGMDAEKFYAFRNDILGSELADAIAAHGQRLAEQHAEQTRARDTETAQRVADAEAKIKAAETLAADATKRAEQIIAAATSRASEIVAARRQEADSYYAEREAAGRERFDFYDKRGLAAEQDARDRAHTDGAKIMEDARAAVASLKELS